MSSLDKLREKIADFKSQFDALSKENSELSDKLAAQNELIDVLKVELKQKDEEIESIIAKLEELLE